MLELLKQLLKYFTQTEAPQQQTTVPLPQNLLPTPEHEFEVGNLTKKYETNNRGPGYISNGSSWGDPGGDSYGSYQIETNKGTMKAYLATTDKYTLALRPFVVNSPGFKDKWRALAAQDPNGFEQSQFNFLASKPGGYYDALKHATKLGWNTNSFAMKSAIYSTSNQSGGWKTGIFNKAGILPTDDIETQINKLYDARADYFRKLKLNKKVKDSIILNRTDENVDGSRSKLNNERDDCLNLAKLYG